MTHTAQHCGGSFGSGGVGSLGVGSGSAFGVTSARQVRLNAVVVNFEGVPQANDPSSSGDALNRENWSVEALSPFGIGEPLAQHVERVGSTSVRVWFDASLDPEATYRIVASADLLDAYGAPIDPDCLSVLFDTFRTFQRSPLPEPARERTDLANPFMPVDAPKAGAPLGTYQVTESGDYALERGRQYLRKRIFRRITSLRGSFFHLANYGMGVQPKTLVRRGLVRQLQAQAQAQISREPDVVSVSVAASEPQPGLVIMSLRVFHSLGGDPLDMDVPIDFR